MGINKYFSPYLYSFLCKAKGVNNVFVLQVRPSHIKIINITIFREKNQRKIKRFIQKHSDILKVNLKEMLSGEIIEQLAKDSGFVKRTSLINGNNFLELLLSNCIKGTLLSLEDLAENFEESIGHSISKQGLDERFNSETVSFLQSVLSNLLHQQLSNTLKSNSKFNFSTCRLKDSTRFGLPEQYRSAYKGHGGATNTKSMISIQYEFDLLTGNHLDLQLTSGCRNDQRDSNESVNTINEGELLIRDLGYVTTTYLTGVAGKNAFFLNRLPSQMNVYYANDNHKEVDFCKIMKKLRRYNLRYMALDVLIGKKAQLPCRLVVSLCEKEAAKKRLNKTTKNTKSIGCKVSKKTKTRSKLNLYITNAPEDKINAKDVYHIYTLRWQIELIFKAWKSICNIDKIKKVKIHRFESILLSGLIWTLANWQFLQLGNKWLLDKKDDIKSLSIWKFYKHIAEDNKKLCNMIKGKDSIDDWLVLMLNKAENKLYRETKKGDLSHMQRFNKLLCA